MPTNNLWAGALSQLLIHQESGCPHSARHAIRLLDQLCEFADLDAEVRLLCERASQRLGQHLDKGRERRREEPHAGAA
ncbi:MAG: hypothetical protein HYU78_03695 [Rhodocyclales bacterium]|nr:hypothetical protein [Rhodocyclales bacterium]